MFDFKNTIVISLGGSLVFPHNIDVDFLKKFKQIVLGYIKNNNRVVIVTGGGRICRKYNEAALKLSNKVIDNELDWMGIKATKVNAELVRIMFDNKAYYKVVDKPGERLLKQKNRPIIVAGGWKPGASSDNMAVNLAKQFKAEKVINLSNIDYVYDKDPKKFSNARILKEVNWSDFRKIVGNKWTPGANWPFDPIASKLAQKIGVEVVIMNGNNLSNLNSYLNGRKFIGSVIKN